jgi:hypothetical protein
MTLVSNIEEVKTNRNIHKKSAVLIANLLDMPKEVKSYQQQELIKKFVQLRQER